MAGPWEISQAGRRRIVALGAALAACLALVWPASGDAASPKTITVAAATPNVNNCWPFGEATEPMDLWTPYFGFVYKNIPAFDLKRGDTLAFDSGLANDHDIQVDVALAATTSNGGDVNAGPFTTIAHNTQTPTSPRGDDIAGNYELGFVAQTSFNFSGGGLIVRVSNPGPAFLPDDTCDWQLVGNDAPDTSGFFVKRVFTDPDGVSPWADEDDGPLGQFRLTLLPESNKVSLGKLKRNKKKGTARLPVTVPGKGTLALSGKGVKAQKAAATAEASVAGEGTVLLPVKAKGKARKGLFSTGKAKLRLRLTFTPTSDPADPPKTRQVKVKLLKKLG
jgi:hypothetical protein